MGGGTDQTECIVVVDGVVGEITEFCLLGGPNGGKSSTGNLARAVVVVVDVVLEVVGVTR